MVVTDVPAHLHIKCDFWISTFWWETANSNMSVLVAIIMTSIIRSESSKLLTARRQMLCLLYVMSWCIVLFCVMHLTSLPMQRCCPTPFSHLWWRLILQALQRRPCFAVFPARNTTCLAVVPDTHTEERQQVQICHVRDSKGEKWVANYTQKGRANGKYCSEHVSFVNLLSLHTYS